MTVPRRQSTAARPSDLAIVVAALSFPAGKKRLSADELRVRLRSFGFEASTQQVAAWLRRMAREECPAFEVLHNWSEGGIGGNDYAVTQYGRTWVRNTLPGIARRTELLPREHHSSEDGDR